LQNTLHFILGTDEAQVTRDAGPRRNRIQVTFENSCMGTTDIQMRFFDFLANEGRPAKSDPPYMIGSYATIGRTTIDCVFVHLWPKALDANVVEDRLHRLHKEQLQLGVQGHDLIGRDQRAPARRLGNNGKSGRSSWRVAQGCFRHEGPARCEAKISARSYQLVHEFWRGTKEAFHKAPSQDFWSDRIRCDPFVQAVLAIPQTFWRELPAANRNLRDFT
jgi:hypothetical protein